MAKPALTGGIPRRTFLRTAAAAAFGTLCSPFINFSRAASGAPLERAAFTMGSIVTFTVYEEDERAADAAVDEAIREMKRIDTLMSVFDPASQLSHVNGQRGREEVAVDTRIIEVCLRAEEFHRLTGGAFDPTVEPLMRLYGFRDDATEHRFPTDAEIARTLEAVGMGNVEVDPARGTIGLTHGGTKLDFGGIAVGYAVDRAAAILTSRGITSGLINHSGDLYAIGRPPDSERWSIGIRDPQNPEGIITTMTIRDQALCTSGNYEHFIRAGGRTIGHILDPWTGRGAETLLSSTVVAPTACEADALSTAVFVRRSAVAARPQVSCVIVPTGGDEAVRLF